MISRITDQMLLNRSQANLQRQLSQLAVRQSQASSGLAISKPSDNPTGMAESLALKSAQAANAQYTSNASDGMNWLGAVSGALTSTLDALQKVRTLTVEAASTGANSTNSNAAIVTQLNSLKAQLMSEANTSYLGRPVFAGNSNSATAFNPDYSFNGTAGVTVTRRISSSNAISVSGDGAAAFGTGAGSVFALIDTVTNTIQTGGNVNAQLSGLDSRLAAITAEQSRIGASYGQVSEAQSTLTAQATTLTTERSNVDNVDLTRAVLDLTAQQNAYQAALAVTSKTLPPTLMSLLQ